MKCKEDKVCNFCGAILHESYYRKYNDYYFCIECGSIEELETINKLLKSKNLVL